MLLSEVWFLSNNLSLNFSFNLVIGNQVLAQFYKLSYWGCIQSYMDYIFFLLLNLFIYFFKFQYSFILLKILFIRIIWILLIIFKILFIWLIDQNIFKLILLYSIISFDSLYRIDFLKILIIGILKIIAYISIRVRIWLNLKWFSLLSLSFQIVIFNLKFSKLKFSFKKLEIAIKTILSTSRINGTSISLYFLLK